MEYFYGKGPIITLHKPASAVTVHWVLYITAGGSRVLRSHARAYSRSSTTSRWKFPARCGWPGRGPGQVQTGAKMA